MSSLFLEEGEQSMAIVDRPNARPNNPCFSSGPCAKRPGYALDCLRGAFQGRAHRHEEGRAKLLEVIERSRSVLGVPADYKVGVLPGSDTGAFELALWNLLGARGVDCLVWERFGAEWRIDVTDELKLQDVRVLEAPFGAICDLDSVDFSRDVIFTWNGTTSGVMVPNGDWIASGREGLTFCDATSAAFALDLPWDKLDVTTWSWQKAMGGEAAHGMLVMSPRAVERLETHTPAWPVPKIFRIKKDGKLFDEPFEGATLNTPSMLCVEDAIDGLKWAEEIGGAPVLRRRNAANFAAIEAWVARTPWVDFLSSEPAIRSTTSVQLKVTDPAFEHLSDDEMKNQCKRIVRLVEAEEAGYDFASHRAAPAGFRIWAGATVETTDLEALFPWIEWAFHQVRAEVAEDTA